MFDGEVPTATIENKKKVRLFVNLRNVFGLDSVTPPVNALKHFNCIVLFCQKESNLEMSLRHHEMTPIPISCFPEKNQLIYEGEKAAFPQKCMKVNFLPINS